MDVLCLQVSAVLDRKEALLMQLRNMNDEAEAGLHLDNTGRHTEAFQVQYAHIVLELKQVGNLFTLTFFLQDSIWPILDGLDPLRLFVWTCCYRCSELHGSVGVCNKMMPFLSM